MRAWLMAVAVAAIGVVASGCATTMTASSYARPGLTLTPYRTYAWGPTDALPAGDPRLERDPFFRDHVAGAIEKALAARGLEHVHTGPPDLLVHYHASIGTRLDVHTVDAEYRDCSGRRCDAGVIQYEAGTLVVDLVDARTNRLVWRGWAQDAIDAALRSRDAMSDHIDEAVTRLMAGLPGGRP